jgi:two-component system, OmpR family, sensor histidine kinase CiaH
MPDQRKRSEGRATGQPVLLFGLVGLYVVLQFLWWAWLLVNKDKEVSTLQQQLMREGVMPAVPVHEPDKVLWMVAGEGGVFLLLVLVALWIIFRTVKHELSLARQQRDFLLAASHELRTPITGLKLHLQTLQRPGLPTEKRDELASTARSEVDRLHALTEKILLATQLAVPALPLKKGAVDIAALVGTVCRSAELTYGRQHHVHCDAPAELVIQSDADALRSIAENLVENACKYAPPGTKVDVSLTKHRDHVELVVSDEGPGVPEAERVLIFHKFHRGGDEATRSTKGTGLGLYIVDRLAQRLGGRVEYRQRTPQGSIFAAYFPLP